METTFDLNRHRSPKASWFQRLGGENVWKETPSWSVGSFPTAASSRALNGVNAKADTTGTGAAVNVSEERSAWAKLLTKSFLVDPLRGSKTALEQILSCCSSKAKKKACRAKRLYKTTASSAFWLMQDGLGLRQLRGWQPDGGTLSLKKDTGLEGVGNSDRRGAPMGIRISGVGILTTTLTPTSHCGKKVGQVASNQVA